MKKFLKIFTSTLSISVLAGSIIFLLALICEPVGCVVFGICFGNRYQKATEINIHIGGLVKKKSVYKAGGKPFLLVGPIIFDDGVKDFFFVNKKQVIRTSTDKSGEAWVRIFNTLLIMDDLSDYWKCIRAPVWDDVKGDPSGSISYNEKKQIYCYKFHIENHQKSVYFEIPLMFFTQDMENAPNITLKDYKINR